MVRLCLCYIQIAVKLCCLPWILHWQLPPPLPLLLCPCPETHTHTSNELTQIATPQHKHTHTPTTLYSRDVWVWRVCRLSCKTELHVFAAVTYVMFGGWGRRREGGMDGWMEDKGKPQGSEGRFEQKRKKTNPWPTALTGLGYISTAILAPLCFSLQAYFPIYPHS